MKSSKINNNSITKVITNIKAQEDIVIFGSNNGMAGSVREDGIVAHIIMEEEAEEEISGKIYAKLS